VENSLWPKLGFYDFDRHNWPLHKQHIDLLQYPCGIQWCPQDRHFPEMITLNHMGIYFVFFLAVPRVQAAKFCPYFLPPMNVHGAYKDRVLNPIETLGLQIVMYLGATLGVGNVVIHKSYHGSVGAKRFEQILP
jgi:hypothetical protein